VKKYLAGIIVLQLTVIVYLFQQQAELRERIKESAEDVSHSTKTLQVISDNAKDYEFQLFQCRSELSKYRDQLEQKQWP
jgi:hypothetical protein